MDTSAPLPAGFPRALFLFSLIYGGMVVLGGVLGSKQLALGPLAVEAGIFPFLTVISISSGVAELYGKPMADRLVRIGFLPLILAICLTFLVLELPTDPGMYEPAKAAFPIVLGQSWRMMIAGIIAYGISATLNVWIFSRLRAATGRGASLRGFIAAALSQVIDTLLFISISFIGVRPILNLMIGQMLAKVTLSAVLVPLIIALVVRIGRRLDAQT